MPGAAEPSVSIVLLCYRDAEFIKTSVQSALAQTHPCNIIISNDASDDGTYETAQRLASAYSGIHKVSVRRNAQNTGVAGHVNTVLPLIQDDILVMMAGDDISNENRVAKLLSIFTNNPKVMAVGSDFQPIDSEGKPCPLNLRVQAGVMQLEDFKRNSSLTSIVGATLAFRREVFASFGPLLGPIEDNSLTLRAALLGECFISPDKLVQYRQHTNSVSAGVFARNEPKEVAKQRRYERTIRFYRGTADDLEQCVKKTEALDSSKKSAALNIINRYRLEADAREVMLLQPKRFWIKPILRGLSQPGMRLKSIERAMKLLVPRKFLGL
jgi:glycosyltransferase involved in cell wall biosynthesis